MILMAYQKNNLLRIIQQNIWTYETLFQVLTLARTKEGGFPFDNSARNNSTTFSILSITTFLKKQ